MQPLNENTEIGEEAEALSPHLNHSNNRRNKRFQACVSCRTTKTKCLPSDRPDICQACLRASRTCIMPGPPKPRMKSAQKFSELERKIEMLTNALAGNNQSQANDQDSTEALQNIRGFRPDPLRSNQSPPVSNENECLMRSISYEDSFSPAYLDPLRDSHLDVVQDGLVERETATHLFIHWKTNMSAFLPVVFLPPEMNIERIRETKPLLFLAILTVASSSNYPSMSAQLVTRLTTELGQQIFAQGNQNVDIILAALLFSQYYFQPGGATNLAPSQYTYAAIAMCSDLGLHANAKGVLVEHTESATEAARVCLSEWYAASITSVLLTRNTLVRHHSDLEKYTAILSQDHLQLDTRLFSLLKLQRILESAAVLLDTFESKSENAFDEPSTQYKINMLQQQVVAWEQEIPEGVDLRLKQHGLQTAYLQIHVIAVRCFIRKMVRLKHGSNASNLAQESDVMGLTPSHFDCLTKCLEAVKAVCDIYLSLEIPLARCLPNSYLFWNINAAVILIKLGHFGEVLTKLHHPPANVGGNTTPAPFQSTVIYYLDAVAAKMDQVCQDGYLPQAKPFVKVIKKLKPYYLQARSICISRDGHGVLVEHEGLHSRSDHSKASRPPYSRSTSGSAHVQPAEMLRPRQYGHSPIQQAASSRESLSHSGWTPSSDFSQGQFQAPQFSGPYGDQLGSPQVNLSAAYDPYTYANTDWSTLALDSNAVQQLDSFIFAEEDNAWMHSLL